MSVGDEDPTTRLIETIRSTFPALRMNVEAEHPEVDLLLDVPKQAGLDFAVNVNVQGDELHLSAGAFWVVWFPSIDAAVREAFHDAVVGLLSGRYRIVEQYVGRWPAKAELQRPLAGEWHTLATWSGLASWLPWRRRTRVLQNHRAD